MKKTFILPLLSSVVMGVVAFLVYYGVRYVLKSNVVALMISVVMAVITYFIAVLKFKVITEEELASFPKGNLIKKVAKKIHLL